MSTKIQWCDLRRGTSRIHAHSGYFLVYCPGHPYAKSKGHIYEHRYVVEKYLERFLEPDEFVHHCNGNRSDNRIQNLDIVLNGAHVSNHFRFRSNRLIKKQIQALKDCAKSRRNPRLTICCACGCGQKILTPDERGRSRRYIQGHNAKGATWKWKKNII